MQFWYELDEMSDIVSMQPLTRTLLDRPFNLVTIADPPITTPQEAALKKFSFPEPEELSPPILAAHSAAVGYDGKAVLRRLDLRIDHDDRIALLGRNGEGKSTLSKLFAGKLEAMQGNLARSNKLRIGYFAQHQLEELRPDETPLDTLRRLRPNEAPGKHRTRLAGHKATRILRNE